MNVLTISTLFFYIIQKSILGDNLHILSNKIHQSYFKFKFHQITIFKDDFTNNNDIVDIFIQNVSSHAPTVLIDSAKIQNTGDNRTLCTPVFKHPRSSTFFVILINHHNNFYLNHINYIVENILARLSPIPVRPRCLVILFSDNVAAENKWIHISSYAWSLKFLDFTIVQVNSDDTIISNYNPFNNSYNIEYLTQEIDIFPDKLSNMYKYPLKFPIWHIPPFSIVYKNSLKEITRIEGGDYIFLETFSHVMNFTRQPVRLTFKNFTYKFMMNKLENNEINLLPKGYIQTILLKHNVVSGIPYGTSYYAVIVPNLTVSYIGISYSTFIPFIIIIIVITMFLKISRVFKFPVEQWHEVDIFRILLNITAPMNPQKWIERIYYLLLIILSMNYCTDVFAQWTSLQLQNNKVSLNTWEEIDKSGMPVYCSDTLPNVVKTYRLLMPSLISKLQPEPIKVCVERLARGEKIICILPYLSAKYYTNRYITKSGSGMMKYTSLTLVENSAVFPYEKACPYIEKFDQITQRIVDHGILQSWRFREKYWKTSWNITEKSKEENESVILVIHLIHILCIGYIIATIVLTFEYLSQNAHKYRMKICIHLT